MSVMEFPVETNEVTADLGPIDDRPKEEPQTTATENERCIRVQYNPDTDEILIIDGDYYDREALRQSIIQALKEADPDGRRKSMLLSKLCAAFSFSTEELCPPASGIVDVLDRAEDVHTLLRAVGPEDVSDDPASDNDDDDDGDI